MGVPVDDYLVDGCKGQWSKPRESTHTLYSHAISDASIHKPRILLVHVGLATVTFLAFSMPGGD
ncbi:MAG: hypothetical protein C7B46_01410 [Sulfobacillus benefaciens]|uniref:Uncharacterized protein n=1 Tax=Sulfobacillus benefaciens TaxID=453960 RepID=A0A2T2XLJ3_9FIRM|nr:MAG: hypothetical protein C7B46_01410 [Sulfobacillus benefaciens]